MYSYCTGKSKPLEDEALCRHMEVRGYIKDIILERTHPHANFTIYTILPWISSTQRIIMGISTCLQKIKYSN